jgi:hypothetical protein
MGVNIKMNIMKAGKLLMTIFIMLTFSGCKKDTVNQQIIPIPNGDFELWDTMPNLYDWQTNSCPACVPPYETYIVQKVTDASHGQYAAKFIYNNVYSSLANNKFPISLHPSLLTGYIKSDIANGDTAIIHVDLFSGNNIVDDGNFYETSSNANYKKIEISISQTSPTVDSALIKIVGGKKQNTELYVDNLVFLKNN